MMKIENPLVVKLETTMDCNHRCGYCYNPRESLDRLSSDEQKKRIKKITEIILSWGTFDITFTGGEPFINKPVLYAGIETVKNYGADYSINTNASLINSDDARILRETGATSLFVSFPSHKESDFDLNVGVKGAYNRVLKGLDAIAKENIKVTINTVVTKKPADNLMDVYDTAKFLIERYPNIVRFATASISPNYSDQSELMRNSDDISKIFEQMVAVHNDFGVDIRNSRPLPICFSEGLDPKFRSYDLFRGCTIGIANAITVTQDGGLKLCPVLNLPVANVIQDTYTEIKDIISKFDGNDPECLKRISPEECLDCSILETCKGGCKSESLALGKDFKRKSRYLKNPQTDSSLLLEIMQDNNLVQVERFNVREKIRWRKDGENYVIRGEKFALLTEAEFEMLQYLKNLGTFSPMEICKKFDFNSELFNIFLNKLEKAKAILV